MAWKKSISRKHLIEFLNSLLEIDRVSMTVLFNFRFPCNYALAQHETVQVQALPNGFTQVGLLGILNGAFGVDEDSWGSIGMRIENNEIKEFFEVDASTKTGLKDDRQMEMFPSQESNVEASK